MKQIFQNLKNGELSFLEVPYPTLEKNKIIIKTVKSLISSGTEKYLLKFGKSNYFQKAISEPERLEQVIAKIKNDGFYATYDAVKSKLDSPFPMGYCNVGIVDKSNCFEFKKGDRVVSNSNHSELVISNPNFTCLIPNNVSDQDACYAIPLSICIHGIRLLNLTFGETIVVYGLGLLGLLSIQILKNSGYKVCGIDTNFERIEIAKSIGIEAFDGNDKNLDKKIKDFNKGKIVDGALITASSNDENLLNNISKTIRQKGKILCIGTVPIKFDRNLIYKKEISFQVSASYGPERYNQNYEKSDFDYPLGIARWSVKRNIEYALELIETKKIDLGKLTNEIYSFDNAKKAYEDLLHLNSVALILNYSENINKEDEIVFKRSVQNTKNDKNNLSIGIIGSGSYSSRYIIPEIIKNKSFNLKTISSAKGVSASFFSKKFDAEKATTNNSKIMNDSNIGSIFIASPHNFHSEQIINGMKKQKKIFVEKPLAISNFQLKEIKKNYQELIGLNKTPFLMVGYNRRYSPLVEIMSNNLKDLESPCSINYNINSGYIDNNSWIQDQNIGGGRIIGEICHFIDLIKFLTSSKIISYDFKYILENKKVSDNIIIQFKLSNNSIANINYFSNGNNSYPKEVIEIYCGGTIMHLNNFKKLKIYGKTKFKGKNLFIQNKGNKECVNDFLFRVKKNKDAPITFEDLYDTSKITLDITDKILS